LLQTKRRKRTGAAGLLKEQDKITVYTRAGCEQLRWINSKEAQIKSKTRWHKTIAVLQELQFTQD
jgi:hypothetical protein